MILGPESMNDFEDAFSLDQVKSYLVILFVFKSNANVFLNVL